MFHGAGLNYIIKTEESHGRAIVASTDFCLMDAEAYAKLHNIYGFVNTENVNYCGLWSSNLSKNRKNMLFFHVLSNVECRNAPFITISYYYLYGGLDVCLPMALRWQFYKK